MTSKSARHASRTKMAKIEPAGDSQSWQDRGRLRALTRWQEHKAVWPLGKRPAGSSPVRLRAAVRPSDSTPGLYPRELKTYVHTETCAHVFIAALFAKPKNGNSLLEVEGCRIPRCLLSFPWWPCRSHWGWDLVAGLNQASSLGYGMILEHAINCSVPNSKGFTQCTAHSGALSG